MAVHHWTQNESDGENVGHISQGTNPDSINVEPEDLSCHQIQNQPVDLSCHRTQEHANDIATSTFNLPNSTETVKNNQPEYLSCSNTNDQDSPTPLSTPGVKLTVPEAVPQIAVENQPTDVNLDSTDKWDDFFKV